MSLIKFPILPMYVTEDFPWVSTCIVCGWWYIRWYWWICLKIDEGFQGLDRNYRFYYLWWIPCKTKWKLDHLVVAGICCSRVVLSLYSHCMTIALLLSSSAQKWDICPFPKEVAGGDAGACAGADIISCVFNCYQKTACFWWVLLCRHHSIQ